MSGPTASHEKTPLVLVPGMMCDERLFGPQVEAFRRERPVIVAGIGEADTVEAMAEAVLRQSPPRFALAGLSLGGIVAMSVMALASERVERLALLDTNPLAERPDVSARREPQIEAVRQGRLAEVMWTQMIPNYFAADTYDNNIAELCLAMATRLGPDVFVRQSHALRKRPDRTDTLAEVRVPTLILSGVDDRLCPKDRQDLMHQLIRFSRIAFVDGAGHLPTLQRPAVTTELLQDWLTAK